MIKLFEQFNEYSQVKTWLDDMGIRNYTINDDLTVDVNGDVDISEKKLTEIPIQFGIIKRDFDCYDNLLTTLKGCPKYVRGSFDCSDNKLTSLEYSPIETNSFYCSNNRLTNLKGCPNIITEDFSFPQNYITTLKYFPLQVDGNILFYDNPLPEEVTDFRDGTIFLKYHLEYGIWNSDGSFNKERFDIFLQDYKDGILT